MLMPLHRHFDGGFGATGEAFKEAADQLVAAKTEGSFQFINGHLPINFLYRHAIELFLKSMIIVIHKRLQLPGDDWFEDPDPKVVVNGKWREIHQVHGVQELYSFLRALLHAYAEAIGQIAKTDWSFLPDELGSWIVTIGNADSASTFFRYPTKNNPEGDVEKSAVKEIKPDDAVAQISHPKIESGEPRTKIYLLLKNESNQAVRAYGLDHEPLPKIREALTRAAELLWGMHLGIFAELANGQ
jgi:hypothetical protein